jgi:demethylmenaquinone methyltransferase/2-methoxy-6-polyprenyl-1,4-benzoquinol methylase
VLKAGGKATILEFQLPENKIFRGLYKFYFKKILPFLGGIISKNKTAYRYLPDSVEEFDEEISLVDLLNEAGFSSVTKHKLTFGIVQVVIAEK